MTEQDTTPQYVIIRYGYADADAISKLAQAKNFDALLVYPHKITNDPVAVGQFNPQGVARLTPFGSILWKNTSTESVNGMLLSKPFGTYDEEKPVNMCFRIK